MQIEWIKNVYESYRDHNEETIYINRESNYVWMNYSQVNEACDYEFYHRYLFV